MYCERQLSIKYLYTVIEAHNYALHASDHCHTQACKYHDFLDESKIIVRIERLMFVHLLGKFIQECGNCQGDKRKRKGYAISAIIRDMSRANKRPALFIIH